jgi:hypothetical protein
MAFKMEAILGAFIGAVIGSLGTVLLENWLRYRRELYERENQLVERYLLQLQNSLESLYYRFTNISKLGGRKLMSEQYYNISTLYAIACVLAFKQILLLDGAYSKLLRFKGIKNDLRRNLQEIDWMLDDSVFLHYHRLALAESVIEKDKEHSRISTYIDFSRRYQEDAILRQAINPAEEFVKRIDSARVDQVLRHLQSLILQIEKLTNLPSAIHISEARRTSSSSHQSF